LGAGLLLVLTTSYHPRKAGDPEVTRRLEKAILEQRGRGMVAEEVPGEEDGATVSTVTP
jgi:hypothetical protein